MTPSVEPSDVELKSLDYMMTQGLMYLNTEGDIDTAFPRLTSHPPSRASGFTIPLHCLLDELVWLWLAAHGRVSRTIVRERVDAVIARGVAVNRRDDASPYLRDDHDSLLIQYALIAGSLPQIEDAADSLAITTGGGEPASACFLRAWTGLLAAAIRKDTKGEAAHWSDLQRLTAPKVFLWPSNALCKAFVGRDAKELERQVKKGCERHWVIAERDSALRRSGREKVQLDVARKHRHFFWPWVEAAFVRAARLHCIDVTYRSFWLPVDVFRSLDNC